MDTITSLVGILETALEGGEPTTSLSSLNALYALYALQNRAEAAEAEVGRLQAALDQWKQRCDAIMLCATGRAAPLSDSEVCGEIVRLRERNKELEMWFSVALDLLSDFLETLN